MRFFALVPAVGLLCVVSGCAPKGDDVTYVHQYGVHMTREEWGKRGCNGQVITHEPDGVTLTRTFVDNVLDGKTVYTYPDSEVPQRVEIYAKGQLNGMTTYSLTGSPVEETSWEDNSRKVRTWFENGSPNIRENYLSGRLMYGDYYSPEQTVEAHVENGKGARVLRDRSGLLTTRDIIDKGAIAERTTYYSLGSPESIATYSNGEINGTRRTFHRAGDPASVEEWVNGQLEGTTTLYESGERIAEIPYVAGKKEGIEKRYGPNGVLQSEITWVDGLRSGPTHIYDGADERTEWYNKGAPVSRATYQTMQRH